MEYLKSLAKGFSSFALKATFVFFLVIAVVFISGTILFNQQRQLTDRSTFEIQGKSERKIDNDVAYINLGSYLEGTSVTKLQADATAAINKALDELKKLEIPEEKIQTSAYNLQPKYNYTTNKIDGYTINIEVEVTLEQVNENTDKVGDVISAATKAGLNEVRSLRFDILDRDKVVEELKLEAIEDAKSRKDSYQNSTGIRLGSLKDVQFGSDPYYPPYYYGDDRDESAGGGGAPTSPDPDVNVKPGQTKLTTTVVLYFEVL